MAAYRQVGADAKNRDQLRNPALGNRVWATFFYDNAHLHKKWGNRLRGADKPRQNVIKYVNFVGLL